MKNLILFIIFLILNNFCNAQSEKTIIKSFIVNTTDVVIDLECNKTIFTWDKNYIRLELVVTTNYKREVLDVLTKNGRYNIESKVVNQTLTLYLPNMKEKVKFGEIDLIENFHFKLWLPGDKQNLEGINL